MHNGSYPDEFTSLPLGYQTNPNSHSFPPSPGFTNTFQTNPNPIGNFGYHNSFNYQHLPKGPIISFAPQTLSSLLEGVFACIRQNSKTLFGLSLSIMTIVGVIAGILSIISGQSVIPLSTWYNFWPQEYSNTEIGDEISSFIDFSIPWLQILFSVLYFIATWTAGFLITGITAIVVSKAVVGLNPTLTEVWLELKQKFGTLVGTTILSSIIPALPLVLVQVVMIVILLISPSLLAVLLYFLLSIAATFFMWFMQFCFVLAPIIAVIEQIGPIKSVQRSYKLVTRSFWRTLGRIILVLFVLGTACSTITGLVALFSFFTISLEQNPLFLFMSAILPSLATGIMWAIGASVPSLIYIDERIRYENLAPALLDAYQQNTQQVT